MIPLDDWHRFLMVMALCVPRLGAALVVIPVLGRQVVPGLVRNGITLSFALILYPVVEAAAPRDQIAALTLLALVLKEAFLGLVLGYVFACLFWSVEAAGYLIDNLRGAALADTLNPLSGEMTSPLGILFLQFTVVLVFASGLFLHLLGVLYASHLVWPVFSFVPRLEDMAGPGPRAFLQALDQMMGLAVMLAAPALMAMVLSELGLALISRFAPQLQVFFLAMPIKSALAILVLILYLPTLQTYILERFRAVDLLLPMLDRLFR